MGMVSFVLHSTALNSWEPVYLLGSHPALGSWQPRAVRLNWKNGTYSAEVTIPTGEEFEYLFSRGGYRDVESDADGGEVRPHRAVAFEGLTLRHEVPAWGRDSLKFHPDMTSQHLPHPHHVWVHLPPGYHHEAERRYPVMYLHDGQNLFEAHRAFAGVAWDCDDAAERLVRTRKAAAVIQVGVGNTPDRIKEYGPLNRGDDLALGYQRFLIDELKPMIDSTYRTLGDARYTGLGGSSLGGLMSLHLARERPDVFGCCAAMSPSLWWDDEHLLHAIEREPAGLQHTRLWLDMGGLEGFSDHGRWANIRRARALAACLAYRSDGVCYRELPDGLHNEWAWAERYPNVLEFLFPVRN